MSSALIEMTPSRHLRYATLLPVDRLIQTPVTIIGVGAIGREIALKLAEQGVRNFMLWDPDRVGEENLGPQGYRPAQIGHMKALATQDDIVEIAGEDEINTVAFDEAFQPTAPTPVVFCCVDSIQVRANIFKALRKWESLDLFVDTRMGAEVCQVYHHTRATPPRKYTDSLFPESEAYQAPCTAKATRYCASIAAGLALSVYARWLREIPTPSPITLDLLGMYMEA